MSLDSFSLYYINKTRFTPDTAMRTYDLSWHNGPNRQRRAFKRLGVTDDELRGAASSLVAIMVARDQWYADSLTSDNVIEMVGEWYTWYQITSGELRTWKYRPGMRGQRVRAKEIPKPFLRGLTSIGSRPRR